MNLSDAMELELFKVLNKTEQRRLARAWLRTQEAYADHHEADAGLSWARLEERLHDLERLRAEAELEAKLSKSDDTSAAADWSLNTGIG